MGGAGGNGSGGAGGSPVDMARDPTGDMAKPVAHPFLTVTSTGTGNTSTVNLTTVGTVDWAHWGFSKPDDFDHKATGNGQISDFVELANTTTKQFSSALTTFSWTDGLSGGGGHPTNAGGSDTDVYSNGGGYRVTVPAGVAPRRLIFYCGLVNAQARMQIALGDGSAPAHDDSMWKRSDNNLEDVVYTIDYAAASDGQQLTVTWSQAADLTPILGTPAAVGIASAALTTPPPTN